ncbi:MAG: hypothetical protein ACOYOV_03090 [Bacteroidales bacterium]
MKNFSKYLFFIPFFAIVLMFGNTSCKEDTDCKMQIIVKLFSDTTILVPNAQIWIHQNDISLFGTTDATGKFEHTFALEAIYNVKATDSTIIDPNATPPTYSLRTAEATVRLKPGETVSKVILVK